MSSASAKLLPEHPVVGYRDFRGSRQGGDGVVSCCEEEGSGDVKKRKAEGSIFVLLLLLLLLS